MKKLLLLTMAIGTYDLFAACAVTTRTNYSSNSILTSSALNADFNQLVTKANAFTGECLTNQTVDLTTKPTGVLPLVNGGTGISTISSGYILSGGASTVSSIAPGTSGNYLVSNGSAWISTPSTTSFVKLGTVTALAAAGSTTFTHNHGTKVGIILYQNGKTDLIGSGTYQIDPLCNGLVVTVNSTTALTLRNDGIANYNVQCLDGSAIWVMYL